MESSLEIEVLETYRQIPILHVQYSQPTFLNRETHEEQARVLLELPHERFAAIVSYQNLSIDPAYDAQEQAETFQSDTFQALRDRAVALVRYHSYSLTTMVHTMSAHMLLRGGASNFAPDVSTALKAARRAVDQLLVDQR